MRGGPVRAAATPAGCQGASMERTGSFPAFRQPSCSIEEAGGVVKSQDALK